MVSAEPGPNPDTGTVSPMSTRVYVGPNKNSEWPRAVTQDYLASRTAKVYLGTIPDEVPAIGGSDLSLKFSVAFRFTKINADIAFCLDDTCITIVGAGYSYSKSTLCLDTKVSVSAVPITLEGCLTFNGSFDPLGVDVGISVEACIGRDLCDVNGSGGGWDYNLACALCKSFSKSTTI